MEMTRYAVVEDAGQSGYPHKPFSFSKWHDSQIAAREEAKRLAKKEQKRFLIIKLMGFSEPETIPVKEEFWEK